MLTWLACIPVALAGLVGITAGCDGTSMPAVWIVDFLAGLLVVYLVLIVDSLMINSLKLDSLKFDEPVDAFSVHGTCGIRAKLAVGLFNTEKGLLTSHGRHQLGVQIVAIWALGLFSRVSSGCSGCSGPSSASSMAGIASANPRRSKALTLWSTVWSPIPTSPPPNELIERQPCQPSLEESPLVTTSSIKAPPQSAETGQVSRWVRLRAMPFSS